MRSSVLEADSLFGVRRFIVNHSRQRVESAGGDVLPGNDCLPLRDVSVL